MKKSRKELIKRIYDESDYFMRLDIRAEFPKIIKMEVTEGEWYVVMKVDSPLQKQDAIILAPHEGSKYAVGFNHLGNFTGGYAFNRIYNAENHRIRELSAAERILLKNKLRSIKLEL